MVSQTAFTPERAPVSNKEVTTAPSKVKVGSRKTGITVMRNTETKVTPADMACLLNVSDMRLLYHSLKVKMYQLLIAVDS